MTTQSDSRFVKRLIQEVERLLQEALDFELLYAEELKQVDPDFVDSARNLLHYLGVRRHDTEGQGREGRGPAREQQCHAIHGDGIRWRCARR